MSYASDQLQKNEKVIIEGKLHWVLLVRPILYVLIGGLLIGSEGFIRIAGFIVLLFGLFRGIKGVLEYFMTEFAATNKRLIGKTGIIARESLDIRLGKAEGVALQQGIFGRILGYGTVIINAAGTRRVFPHLSNALAIRKQVSELLDEIDEKGYVSQATQSAIQSEDVQLAAD